jgi:AhpD family alkylhydroperoxidase
VKARVNYPKVAPGIYGAMDALDSYIATSGLERGLLNLVFLRASQVNGCAFCIDMHWKDLRAAEETEQRLYGLDAWREAPYYSERERAALAWTEAVTLIASERARDDVYNDVRQQFSEKELADLTLAIATVNAWNRLAIGARLVPGNYKPAAVAHS